jgi:tetratricopeptide (TPR) repeat protein
MPLRTKITLIIFGLFLFLILLEAGLRLGGFVMLSLQDYRNRQSLKHQGTYRIMCLGESTTVDQYPPYLEKALNQRHAGMQFSVIDKGIDGTNSAVILSQLESNLTQYRPDMVVTMMGINDGGSYMPHEAFSTSKIARFFRSFRTYKLTRLLWLHMVTKVEKMRPQAQSYLSQNDRAYVKLGRFYREQRKFSQAEDLFKEAIELNPKNDEACVRLGWLYQSQGKFSQAEDLFKKAIELNPKKDCAYFCLGWLYQAQGKFSQSEGSFKKAIELNPKNDEACVRLGWLYQDQDKLSQAEDLFKKSIELNPKNDCAYFCLGWLYRNQGKPSQAEDSFKKAIELNPKNEDAYVGLGELYENQGKFSQAEDSLKRASELSPRNDGVYVELGWSYRSEGKLFQAEDSFKKAIELNPQNERAYEALSIVCEAMGKPELAKAYTEKADRLRLEQLNPITVQNYRSLKSILDKKGIRLVCVQYPMRSIELLKKTFQGEEENVIFVNNEKIFRDAVKKDGYRIYFRDAFGGDFGHCTGKGNQLLAANIANAILKEVVNK